MRVPRENIFFKSISDELRPTPEQREILKVANFTAIANEFDKDATDIYYDRLMKLANLRPSIESFRVQAEYIKAKTVQHYNLVMEDFVARIHKIQQTQENLMRREVYSSESGFSDSIPVQRRGTKRTERSFRKDKEANIQSLPKRQRSAIPSHAKVALAEWLLNRYEISSENCPPDLYARDLELENLSVAAGIHPDRVKIYLTNHRARSKNKSIEQIKAKLKRRIQLIQQSPPSYANWSSSQKSLASLPNYTLPVDKSTKQQHHDIHYINQSR